MTTEATERWNGRGEKKKKMKKNIIQHGRCPRKIL